MKWFGESWGAPVCAPEDNSPLPEAPCAACEERFQANDQGVILPFLGGPGAPAELPYHLACFREALGIGPRRSAAG